MSYADAWQMQRKVAWPRADPGFLFLFQEGGPQANLGRHGRKKAPFFGIFWEKAPFFGVLAGGEGGPRPLRPPLDPPLSMAKGDA